MEFLGRLKIRSKLNALIILIAVILVITGVFGMYGMSASKEALLASYQDHLLGINTLNEIRNRQNLVRLALLTASQETDLFEVTDQLDRVRSQIFHIENLMKEYSGHATDGERKTLYEGFVQARTNFGLTGVMPMLDALSKGDTTTAAALRRGPLNSGYQKASDAIDALVAQQMESARAEHERVTALTGYVYILFIGAIALGMTLSMVVGLLITRPLSRGIGLLRQAVQRLAEGDLTARAELRCKDELGEMAEALNRMAESYAELIGELHQSADSVAGAAASLSQTADHVATGSRTQVEGAATAARSIEELNGAVQEIAKRAEGAVGAADTANTTSDEGQRVVQSAVSGIQQVAATVQQAAQMIVALGQRSDQIGQIVQTIKGIAEQTNLLALNAAIEAARAGEQGRGFAVVADEVRGLAERTARATAEIAEMISGIQQETRNAVSAMENGGRQMESGMQRANDALHSLQQIDSSVKNVVDMIQGIARATRSQSEATQVITVRVEQMAQMARDNSGHVDNTSRASHDLQRLSGRFQQVVSRFRL